MNLSELARPPRCELVARWSLRVVGAGQRSANGSNGRCRAARLLHRLLHRASGLAALPVGAASFGQRRAHGVPRNPQHPRDLRDRHLLRPAQAASLRPGRPAGATKAAAPPAMGRAATPECDRTDGVGSKPCALSSSATAMLASMPLSLSITNSFRWPRGERGCCPMSTGTKSPAWRGR